MSMKIETPAFVIIACIISWSLLTVWSRIILLEYQIAPATFVFIQMLSGGLALVLLAKKRIKSIGITPLKQLYTWGFGFFRVISASFYIAATVYLSASNVAFLGALSVSISVFMVWVLLKRKPRLIELPGHIVMIVAAYFMVMEFTGQFSNPAIWLLLISQIIGTFAIIIGEIHPLNQNNSSGDTLYLTGMVLLASAIILLSLSYLAAEFNNSLPKGFYPEIREAINRFALSDIFNPYAWAFGFAMGVSFRAISIYYSLRSVKLTSTEFYLGAMCIMPFTNLALEILASNLGYLPAYSFDVSSFVLGCFITFGSLYIIYFKRNKRVIQPQTG